LRGTSVSPDAFPLVAGMNAMICLYDVRFHSRILR
jgi:hypothetical protein